MCVFRGLACGQVHNGAAAAQRKAGGRGGVGGSPLEMRAGTGALQGLDVGKRRAGHGPWGAPAWPCGLGGGTNPTLHHKIKYLPWASRGAALQARVPIDLGTNKIHPNRP